MSYREPNEIQKSATAPEQNVDNTEHHQDELLAGRYRVISFLGRGGMGVVYKVEQIFLGKELALKTIDQASQSDIAVRRFQAEARAVFAVNHPNIVSVHDFGLLDDQTPFLAMEFVQGKTLGELIKARSLPLDDVLKIFIQVCFGLAHAHKSGVVHRDIKPNNIMVLDGIPLGTEGSVKILDFGIAKLTQHDGGEIQALTKTGEIFGSPIYMSPEQCTGEKIDHRADVYSLGCVIFEALTGTPPFVGDSALSTMMMHQTAPIPSLKEASLGTNFSPELERVVHTMLSKKPNDRYQDLGVAAHDLAAIKSGQTANLSISAKSAPVVKKQAAPTISMRRHQLVLWIAGVAFTSTLITFLIMQMWFLSQQSNLSTTQAEQAVPTTQSPPTEPAATSPTNALNTPSNPDTKDLSILLQPTLAHSNIVRAKMANGADLKELQKYPNVQEVDLAEISTGDLTDNDLSVLERLKILNLSLHDCGISNVKDFSPLKHLSTLDLSKSSISDTALANIAKLKMLRSLDLDNSRDFSEDGIRQLIPSTSLTTMTLTKGKYTQSFIDEINKKMPQCQIVKYDTEPPLVTLTKESKEPDEYKRIFSVYQKVKAINPNSIAVASCLKNMAINRSKQHQISDAEKLWEQAIQLLEKNQNENALPEYLKNAADCAEENHHPVVAVKYSDRLVELLPATKMHSGLELYEMLKSAVKHPAALHEWQKVIEYCDVGIALAERFPQAPRKVDMFELYSQAGESSIYLNNKSQALKYFQKLAKESDTNRPKDFYWHVSALVQLGRCLPTDEEQKNSCLEGMRLIENQGMPDTFNTLEHYCSACANVGVILLKEGKWEEALESHKKGLAVVETRMADAKKHPDAKFRKQAFALNIINILKRNGRIEEARAMSRKYNINVGL